MSHYFYSNVFDFISDDGNFGYYIEQGNGRTSSNSAVTEEYVIEVHYLGNAITSLNLDVTNIDHTNSLENLFYVEKGFIGTNLQETTQGFRYGNDGQGSYSINTDAQSSIPKTIIQSGSDYWNFQQGGLDPIYGLVEIKIPNNGPTEANGYRDADYLHIESQLYFDVIQQDAGLVDSLQDLIVGDISLSDFATVLHNATSAFASDPFFATADATNDISGSTVNEIPHMVHFDHVNYYGYDDFGLSPTILNTGDQMNSYSETTLIGEFRIDENEIGGVWSFDADMSVWLNTEDRSGKYDPLYAPVGTSMGSAGIYTTQQLVDAGVDNTLNADSAYIVYVLEDYNYNFVGYELQEAVLVDSTNNVWAPAEGSARELLSSAVAIDADFFINTTPNNYFNYDKPMFDDLNAQFINDTTGNLNLSDATITIAKDASGAISFVETVPVVDTLTYGDTVDFAVDTTYGTNTITAGKYIITYNDYTNTGGGINLSFNAISDPDADGYYSSAGGGWFQISGSDAELIVSDINDASLAVTHVQMVSDGMGVDFNVVNINSTIDLIANDNSTIPTGQYLITKNSPDDVTLTPIGPDTDYDGLAELGDSSYKLLVNDGGMNEVTYLSRYIDGVNGLSGDVTTASYILGTHYETADTVVYVMDELGTAWNSVDITGFTYSTVDSTNVPVGIYKVSFDVNTNTVSLQATTFIDPEYEVNDAVAPYVLDPASSQTFFDNVNMGTQNVSQIQYKQYFYDLLDPETHNGMDVLPFMKEQILINGGTEYVEGETFDNTKMNFINTADVTSVTSIDAGENMDFILGGVGGLNINGGSGIDLYVASPASINIVLDQNGKVIAEDGVIVDLTSSRVTYIDAGTEDKVSNIEYFMGSLGDDKFVGSALYDGDIDPSHTFNLQAFNPSKGKDEILGGEDVIDPVTGDVIKVFTGLDYDGMQGGQGVIFILDGSDAAQFATVAQDEISYEKISQFAGEYWSDTSWAGDGWLPSNDDILNENGNFSTVSRYLGDNEGVTLILDSFGDTDLAFNIDHYVGSGEADIFFGSNGNDSFDAASGLGNYMSGGDGLDQLTITDLNEIVSNDNGTPDDDTDDFTEDAGDNIDLDSIIINRLYEHTNYLDVKIGDVSDKIETEVAGVEPTGTLYRIDFAEVADLSSFYQANLSTSVSSQYEISSEYALFLRTTVDLTSTLSGSTDFTFDSVNSKIDVLGTTDLSILDGLTTGQLVLAEEIVGGYIISGQENDGNLYSTVIEDVEQVTLLSDDVSYFGTGEITGSQEDIYQLILGGQGDLGDMLYVATGETLNSTTGVGEYSAGVNFISGEVFYSGHHTDFDRNSSASGWANSVAAAFQVDGQDTARLWNDDVAQFFVWYKPSETADAFEIAVKYQNGDVNAWGIDNRQFDTFQNVIIDQNIADAINTQFGDAVDVELGEYRVLYEAAFTDIETLISSSDDVKNWNFDFQPASSRSTFYIQVGGDATGVNGSSGISDTLVTNVKVERIDDGAGGFIWNINPQAEILVNLPVLPGADENDNVMISGASAETIEAGKGSDIMMGRGGSDNYKIVAGDTLDASGNSVIGSYGVAGDVINEIGGSSEDKSDAITLSSAKSIDEITFSRTEIANEYWGNTLQIDVAYAAGGTDTLYVFDHYNQSHSFRAVEQLFLDDGWDSDEIWNLIVGDIDESTGIDEYVGTAGQDVIIAGTKVSNLYGGDGQDIMIGDQYSKETTFELGNKDGVWDQVSDIIEGFGVNDKLDLSALGITEAAQIKNVGDELQLAADDTVIAQFNNFYDGLTLEQILTEEGAVIYG